MWSEQDVHISARDLKRQYKVCNFWLKAEICWSLKQRRRSAGHSSKPVGSPVCVLRPTHYFTKKVSAIEERHVRTLSDCVFTSHKRRHRRIKYKLYFFISTRFSLFVQGYDMRQFYGRKELNIKKDVCSF